MSTFTARDFARPVVILSNRKAVIRALAAGREVWCAETGEGWQMGEGWVRETCSWAQPGSTIKRARKLVRRILEEEVRQTFFFGSGVK